MKKTTKVIIFLTSLVILAMLCTSLGFIVYVYNVYSALLWQHKIGNTVMSAPIFADGGVYFGSLGRDKAALYALDATTGKERWHTPTNASVSWSPLFSKGKVYFSTDDGFFYAVDAKTGVEKWHFSPEQRDLDSSECDRCALLFRPAIITNGIIYVGSLDHHLYALDAETGAVRWHFSTGDSVLGPPAIVDDRLYLGSMDGNLYVLDVETGKEKQRYSISKGIYSTPIIDKDTIYLVNGSLIALDAKTGTEKWRFNGDSLRELFNISAKSDIPDMPPTEITSNILMLDNILYVITTNALYAVDKTTGEKIWRFSDLQGSVFSEPTLNEDTIYFGDSAGYLYAVDARTGVERKRYNMHMFDFSSYLNWHAEFVHSPRVIEDIIYFGWNDYLYAIKVSK